MSQDAYIFHDASAAAELERLRMIESVFDDRSREWITSAGPLLGRRCLEVGAGAGSIAAWLGKEVGPVGKAVAVDTTIRFLRGLDPQVEVVEGDLTSAAIHEESFDLAHARYVLIHNVDAEAVLDAMIRALKPGGVLVLEEPDFSAAAAFAGPMELRCAFENVQLSIREMFAGRRLNWAFGSLLPGLVEKRAALISVGFDSHLQSGGGGVAEMMRLSTLTLQDAYIATGLATPDDISGYAGFATSPDCWGTYYATVRVLARKAEQD